jgi:hypothetical protein
VNDKFDKWLQNNYGKHGEVAIHQEKKHDYLGMEIDCSKKGKVKISMTKYVESMLEDFPEKLKSTETAVAPASDGLFNKGQGKNFHKERADAYHTMVAKALFYVNMPDQTYSLLLLYCAQGQGPKESQLGKASQTDEVPERYKRTQAGIECRQSILHQVVCGCKFCCPS